VLIGLPELRDRLELRRNRSLYSRIRHRLRLEPNDPDDTRNYIDFRLEAAGLDKDVFTRDGAALIHEASLGTLREVDRICQSALEVAAGQGRTLVERETVTQALDVEPMHSTDGG
jgi:type II secretory pathway predicted ATPase ExeA